GSCKANITADPRLGIVTLNGGPTVTAALQAGSPAVDAGAPSACPPTDQRSAPRVGTCDIGAFEFGSTPPPPAPTPASGPGAQPSGGGSSSQPSGTSGTKAPGSATPTPGTKKRPGKRPSMTFAASGKIRSKSGNATFRLRGAAGKHAGLLWFDD